MVALLRDPHPGSRSLRGYFRWQRGLRDAIKLRIWSRDAIVGLSGWVPRNPRDWKKEKETGPRRQKEKRPRGGHRTEPSL